MPPNGGCRRPAEPFLLGTVAFLLATATVLFGLTLGVVGVHHAAEGGPRAGAANGPATAEPVGRPTATPSFVDALQSATLTAGGLAAVVGVYGVVRRS